MIRWSIFPVLVFSLWLVSCGRNADALPVDGEQLRSDCLRLQQLPEGEIAKETWPKSIRDLKPLKVERQGDRITILQSHEAHRFSRGYYIFSDPQKAPSTRGVWIQRTPWKGIFIFKMEH